MRIQTNLWKAAIFSLIVICCVTAIGSGQKPKKCRSDGAVIKAPKYRIGTVRRGVVDGLPILLLQISVSSEHFNREEMSALAARLRSDFCGERQMSIAIADDY